MSKQTTKPSGGLAVNPWMLAALGVLAVVAVAMFVSNKRASADPSLTAAPPIVSTPEHPIILHTKSPELYEREMDQAGVPAAARKRGAPPIPNP
jgi:hypothetical protein